MMRRAGSADHTHSSGVRNLLKEANLQPRQQVVWCGLLIWGFVATEEAEQIAE